MRYICTLCGYIYNDEKESVPFEQLPDNWRCPACGAPKSRFRPVKDLPNIEDKLKKG